MNNILININNWGDNMSFKDFIKDSIKYSYFLSYFSYCRCKVLSINW